MFIRFNVRRVHPWHIIAVLKKKEIIATVQGITGSVSAYKSYYACSKNKILGFTLDDLMDINVKLYYRLTSFCYSS